MKPKLNQLKNQIQRKIRESSNSYLESVFTDQPENVEETRRPKKRFSAFIKQQKSDSKEITSLKSVGTTYTRPSDKANILNNQFWSAFTNLVRPKLKHLAEPFITKTRLFKYIENFTSKN